MSKKELAGFIRPAIQGTVYHGVETIEAIAEEVGLPVESLAKVCCPDVIRGGRPPDLPRTFPYGS